MNGRPLVVGPALAVIMAGGCASATTKTTTTVHLAQPALSTPLVMAAGGPSVMPGVAAWGDPSGPEYGRNDERLNIGRVPAIDEGQWTEILTVDRTHTNNGRPREFSTTTVRTLQRRVTP